MLLEDTGTIFSEIPVPTCQIIRCHNADEYNINLHSHVQVQIT